ncbi:MAG: RNA-guided pseudouridylation complex pseudouridine synthase subunit Cbf5 [Candidatus Thermoplasmatota archaeon]|nr:RNA-guided pseudouridylation complex pseudouridine synthase subunit Cbf5 [Candidatus Thermoplasmatota archaeon]
MKRPIEDDGVIQIVSAETDPRFGSDPSERKLNELLDRGAVILDKPRGPTSHQVVSWLRSILEVDKAGHHGTLDPNTTGVLPVALGSAVRVLDLSLPEGKEYIAIMHLHREPPMEHIERVLGEFTGEIYQMVPVRSAVKRGLRQRKIGYIKLLEKEGNDLLLLIGCESGTYIRTLIHDMGEVLGVGANMSELRRTRSGRTGEEKAVRLQDVRDAWEIYKETGDEGRLREVVRPMEELLSHLPRVFIKDSTVDAVCHGAQLSMPGVCGMDGGIRAGDVVVIATLKGEAVAVGEALMDSVQMQSVRKGNAVRTERVLMEPKTYPKAWKNSGN